MVSGEASVTAEVGTVEVSGTAVDEEAGDTDAELVPGAVAVLHEPSTKPVTRTPRVRRTDCVTVPLALGVGGHVELVPLRVGERDPTEALVATPLNQSGAGCDETVDFGIEIHG